MTRTPWLVVSSVRLGMFCKGVSLFLRSRPGWTCTRMTTTAGTTPTPLWVSGQGYLSWYALFTCLVFLAPPAWAPLTVLNKLCFRVATYQPPWCTYSLLPVVLRFIRKCRELFSVHQECRNSLRQTQKTTLFEPANAICKAQEVAFSNRNNS